MDISLKCSCGAEASFTAGTYINGGGVPDAKGRIFRVEVLAYEWLEHHEHCLTKTVTTTAKL